LSLAKAISIGLRSGEYCGRKSIHAPRADSGLSLGAFVNGQIVEDHDIAWHQRGRELRFDVDVEGVPIHRAGDHPRRRQPIMA